MTEPFRMTAAEAARAIRARELSSEELVRSCLARIEEREPVVKAWSHLDPELAIAQARRCDGRPASGPLHGIPVGVKDVIDTGDMPTQYNSPLYQGHRPGRDAACVSLLRSAGAVILGKADTVEFASLGRNPLTTNPLDPRRTPGGSSSGSGAAVGDYMVPLALGTQTGGSVIRPASFCGVYGMKPTYGLVSPEGIKSYAPSLDTIGWMGRSVEDLALVAQALAAVGSEVVEPDADEIRIALCRTPMWDGAEPGSQRAVETAASRLREAGVTVDEVDGPAIFAELTHAQDVVMHWEGQAAYRAEYEADYDLLHPEFRGEVENVKGFTPSDARAAYDLIAEGRRLFDEAFAGYDALLTPAVIGEAPLGLGSTGEALFIRMWTALHGPEVVVPGFVGDHGMPIGVQLVSQRFTDARLLGVTSLLSGLIR